MNNTGHIRMVFVHTLFWLIFVILPPLFVDMSMGMYSSYWLTGVALMFIFYFNFFYLIEKFLFLKKRLFFYFSNVAVISFFLEFNDWWYSQFDESSDFMIRVGVMSRDLFIDVLIVALAIALKYSQQSAEIMLEQKKVELEKLCIEMEKKNMEKIVIEDELNHLRTQLHPHFLFNTLNNIYALIGFEKEKAQDAVVCLSVLLRYVLFEDRLKGPQRIVEIRKEEEFLRTFIQLMDYRMRPNVKISYKADISKFPDAPCLVLIFISMLENAFTYGVSPTEESPIDVLLEVPERNKIHFKIRNRDFSSTRAQKHKVKEIVKESHGIGIKNTKRRLQLVYGDDASFEMINADGYFTIEIILNYTERNYYYNVTQENESVSA